MKIIIYTFTALLFYSCMSKKVPEVIENKSLPFIYLKKTTIETFKEYPTNIEGKMDIEIRPRVNGNLIRLFVDEGSYVKKGQPLFKIDDLSFIEHYNEAKAQLSAAENELKNAKLEVERLLPLIEHKISSEYELKRAKTNQQIALSKVEQIKALVQSAKISIGFTTIRAPIAGYIGRLPKKIGSMISPSDTLPLTTISNIDQVVAYFSLSELDFIEFRKSYQGSTMMEKIEHLPPVSLFLADHSIYSEKGKIDMVNGQFDKTTGSIILRAIFPNTKGLIRSGNTGKIQLGMQHENVYPIPQSATTNIQDKTFVYTLDQDNKVHLEAIEISANSGSNYLIKEELKFGNRIVTKGIDALSDGDRITPIEEK